MNDTPAANAADEATRGSAIKLAAEVLSRLLGLGTTLLLARALGVEGFGALGVGYWYTALVLAELAEFGQQATATRALAARTLSLGSLLRARFLTSGVVAGSALLAFAIAGHGASRQPAAALLPPLVLFFVLAGWGEFFGVVLRCSGARVQEALLLVVLRGGSLAGAAVAAVAGWDLSGFAWSQAASPIPALALGAVLVLRRRAKVAGPSAPIGRVLRSAAPLAVHGGLQILSPRVELLVLFLLTGNRAAGVFGAALKVFEFLSMVPKAVAEGAMPALTREAIGGGSVVRRRTAFSMALIAVPAAVGLVIVAPGVLSLLFTPEYAAAVRPLQIMGVALVPMFMSSLLSWAIVARARASWLPRLTATRAVVAVVLALALIPRLGPTGAALGLLCAESLLLLLAAIACARASFPLPVARPLLVAVAACVPMAAAAAALRHELPAAVGVGVLTWLATLAAARWLAPARVREITRDLRYP